MIFLLELRWFRSMYEIEQNYEEKNEIKKISTWQE